MVGGRRIRSEKQYREGCGRSHEGKIVEWDGENGSCTE